jgi:hypothetical protein
MASLSGQVNYQPLTSLGVLAAGYRLYTYLPGTTTHTNVYTDAAGAVAHTYTSDGAGGQYIALDARGEIPGNLFVNSGGVDLNLKTTAGVTVWTKKAIGTGDASTTALASLAASGGSALVGFLQSGTGTVARTAQAKMRDTVNVNDFSGVDPTGATSSTAGILAACVEAVATGKVLEFSGTYKLSTTLALTSAHSGLRWNLKGATINKGANIDLVTITDTTVFQIDGVGTFDGVMTSYTGKGFVLSGTSAEQFYIGPGILTKAFAGAHVEFGADAGEKSKLMCDMEPDASQTTPKMIHVNGPDTTAMQRSFWGSLRGHITLNGALATRIRCPLVNYVEIDEDCSVTLVDGTSWSNNGVAIPTIDGENTIITCCRFAGDVTLGANMTGAFVGNAQTDGTFTDSSIPGNVIVFHHPLAASYDLVNRQRLTPMTTQQEIQTVSIEGNWGDSSPTFTPDSARNIMPFRSPLTTNRTVTLSTTGARNGMQVRVIREASATGASTLTVGGLKALAVSEWCDVVYDSNTSTWRLTAFGSL